MKLREGNVFTGVCLSTRRGFVCLMWGSLRGGLVPGPRSLPRGGLGMPGSRSLLGLGMPGTPPGRYTPLPQKGTSPWKVHVSPLRRYTPWKVHPREHTPPWKVHPLPLGRYMPLKVHPPILTSSGCHQSQWYASYWNAFLLKLCFTLFICYRLE